MEKIADYPGVFLDAAMINDAITVLRDAVRAASGEDDPRESLEFMTVSRRHESWTFDRLTDFIDELVVAARQPNFVTAGFRYAVTGADGREGRMYMTQYPQGAAIEVEYDTRDVIEAVHAVFRTAD